MGQHKLLLPWPPPPHLADQPNSSSPLEYTVLDAVLEAWKKSVVDAVVVVLKNPNIGKRGEESIHRQLVDVCERNQVHVAIAFDPPDMKASVLAGLEYLQNQYQLKSNDRCFVSPADLPCLKTRVINRMVEFSNAEPSILRPDFAGRSGHPILFPYSILLQAKSLPDDKGVNALIEEYSFATINLPIEDYASDMDTPAEYELLISKENERSKKNGDNQTR